MRCSNSTLAALATESGSRSIVFGRCGADFVSATVRTPPPPWLAAAAAADAARSSPDSDRSDVYANPVVSPATTRIPAPAVASTRHLLDAAVVETGRGRTFVFGVHLREIGARAYRTGEHSFQDIAVDHANDPTGGR